MWHWATVTPRGTVHSGSGQPLGHTGVKRSPSTFPAQITQGPGQSAVCPVWPSDDLRGRRSLEVGLTWEKQHWIP